MKRLARLILAIRIRAAEIHLAQTYCTDGLTEAEIHRLAAVRKCASARLARLRGEYRVRYLPPGESPTYHLA